jgi:5-methylthioadenosine/S-adenosylhomocysteine deaminase
LIKNGLVLTLDPERRVISNGAVAIEDERIVAVGKTSELKKEHSSDEVIDATRKIVMPGLVNAHNHIYQSVLRGLSDDRKRQRPAGGHLNYYWDIIVRQNLNRDSCYAAGMLAAVEMIRSGITTTQDSNFVNFHESAIDGIAQSVVDSGMRVVLGRGCWDVPDLAPEKLTEDVKTAVRESEKVISRWHGKANGRINIRVESSTLAQCTDEMILATKETARRKGVGWAGHVQAKLGSYPFDLRNGNPAINRYNGRGIEYMFDLGVLGSDSLLIHCTTSTNREVAILARTNTPISHCPVANAWSGNPIVTPVPYMLERGVTVGLGTDGPSTNNSLDLFQSMKICALIHKVNLGDKSAITAEKVIEMSTIDSARALNIEADVGSIETGKKADIILLDLNSPGLTPNLLPVKNLIYSSANGNAVNTVIIGGKTIMENQVIKTFDEKEAYSIGEDIGQKLISLSGHLERDPKYLKPTPWNYI